MGAFIVQAARHRCARKQQSAAKGDKEPWSAGAIESIFTTRRKSWTRNGQPPRRDGRKTHEISKCLRRPTPPNTVFPHQAHNSLRRCMCPSCTRHPHQLYRSGWRIHSPSRTPSLRMKTNRSAGQQWSARAKDRFHPHQHAQTMDPHG